MLTRAFDLTVCVCVCVSVSVDAASHFSSNTLTGSIARTWASQSGVRGTVGVCCLGAVCVCVRSLSSVELCDVLSLGRWPGVFTVSPLALICWTHVNALVGGGLDAKQLRGEEATPQGGRHGVGADGLRQTC